MRIIAQPRASDRQAGVPPGAARPVQGMRQAGRRRWLPRWRWHNVVRLLRGLRGSFDRSLDADTAAEAQRLVRAERRGLQLAILCRTLVFAVALLWYVGSLLASGSHPMVLGLAALLVLTLVGVGHFIVIGTRYDRPWIKFAAVTVDMTAICALFVFVPVSQAGDVPQIYAFRTTGAHVLTPFIALSTLALSPRLTLWAGVAAAACWLAAFRIVASGIADPVSWSDIPPDATRAQYEAIFFSADFVGSGTRYTEAIVLVVTAAVLALAVARARRVFFAQIEAEAERAAERARRAEITRRLGRFVPPSVAERLIEDPTVLEPKVTDGAVLVMDVADFTAFADGRDPAEVIATLNDFLARAAEVVSDCDGVVISFTGDGLLATFNTPLSIADPEGAALRAAERLVACGEANAFKVRVGVAAGPVAAGSVGSVQRQAFTVYGDTVNRAARLEAHCKALQVPILIDRAVATRVRDVPIVARGECRLAGFSGPVPVWSVGSLESSEGSR